MEENWIVGLNLWRLNHLHLFHHMACWLLHTLQVLHALWTKVTLLLDAFEGSWKGSLRSSILQSSNPWCHCGAPQVTILRVLSVLERLKYKLHDQRVRLHLTLQNILLSLRTRLVAPCTHPFIWFDFIIATKNSIRIRVAAHSLMISNRLLALVGRLVSISAGSSPIRSLAYVSVRAWLMFERKRRVQDGGCCVGTDTAVEGVVH